MAKFPSSPADNVIGIDDNEAEEVLSALSPDSAREILIALHNGPATVSELADKTDLTAQNISYHLEKLTEADLVRTAGMRGTGGNAATVYEPGKSMSLSTNTGGGYRIRQSFAGILVGSVLALICVSSVAGLAIDSLLLIHQFLPAIPLL